MANESSKFVNADNTQGREAYAASIARIQEGGFCPFCEENLAKEHKNPIIRRGEFWLVTDNMHPYAGAKEHVLFIHKSHVTDLHDLDLGGKAWKELLYLAQDERLQREMHGATLIVRTGDTRYTGGSVTHLHAGLVCGDPSLDPPVPVVTRVG